MAEQCGVMKTPLGQQEVSRLVRCPNFMGCTHDLGQQKLSCLPRLISGCPDKRGSTVHACITLCLHGWSEVHLPMGSLSPKTTGVHCQRGVN